ncbi:MAG: GNAT family N-acetyltransferase [Chloroflexi bacterium]|nr:GNAT family N-acetyltransferase [Chloroflexota bacterium]
MTTIRQMTPADMNAVAPLDVLAFTAYARKIGYEGDISPRTRQNLLACISLNPSGCFVAEADQIVGFIFTHVWGTTGWIGTFGVHPDCQGQGVGRSLLDAAVEYLQRAGCTTIGLETMPESPYNVGLYGRFGFLPIFPTVNLTKETDPSATAWPHAEFGQLDHKKALPAITRISQAACPGLDYAPEVCNAKEYGWGETLLIGWPQPWAFAIVRTAPKPEGKVGPVAYVIALVVQPEARERLMQVLQTVEAFASGRGVGEMSLTVNAADGDALRQALDYGFRVFSIRIRMVLNGAYDYPVGPVLGNWLM